MGIVPLSLSLVCPMLLGSFLSILIVLEINVVCILSRLELGYVLLLLVVAAVEARLGFTLLMRARGGSTCNAPRFLGLPAYF